MVMKWIPEKVPPVYDNIDYIHGSNELKCDLELNSPQSGCKYG